MDVITVAERRRRWRDEDKPRIVAEVEAPGAVFALVAWRHEISRGQLWKWRGQVGRGELASVRVEPEFIPIRVMASAALSMPRALGIGQISGSKRVWRRAGTSKPSDAAGPSQIEIVLPDGTCVRVDDGVGIAALRRVMMAVRR